MYSMQRQVKFGVVELFTHSGDIEMMTCKLKRFELLINLFEYLQ